jgi:primosomal protein N' (replication factor Y)
MADIIRQRKQVLLLVPEIGLTPQTFSRLQKRFGSAVAVWHSGLTDKERFETWLAARDGRVSVILGTRSAIFMPLKNPGLIVVDEEHDPSFKQQDGFRYSARDLAIFRARQLDIPVVLGSATPSLETLANALGKRYEHHQLKLRTGNAQLPEYRCIDLRGESLEEGFSPSLFSEITYHLGKGSQVLVFLNRRGYSPVLLCHHCGHIEECHRCEMAFTLHRHPPALICHHCDSMRKLPGICGACGSTELMPVGLGTERVEQVLEEHFSDYPVIRIDRDSTRRKDSLQEKLDTVNSNQPCILVGTQMLAKGHHFPQVTLVAILDVDRGLFNTGLRSQEQLGQLVTQVAGRAGRGTDGGNVIIQTHHVTHPFLETLINEGYGTLARQLLEERKQTNQPPYAYQALVHAESGNRGLTESFLRDVSRGLIMKKIHGLTVLGPLPAPLEKRAGKFRFQLILQHSQRKLLREGLSLVTGLLERHEHARKVRWSVDIDPTDFS